MKITEIEHYFGNLLQTVITGCNLKRLKLKDDPFIT